MNKKFSTLVAGLLLASSIGTVNADVIDGNFAKYLTAPNAAKVVKAGTYYQLSTATSGDVVAMLPTDNGDYTLKVVGADDATDVRYTLWTIDVQGNPTDGYRYSFLNKGTNMILSVDPATALKALNSNAVADVKGNISVWKWQDAPDPVKGFVFDNAQAGQLAPEVLTSVFGSKNDSTVTLVAGTNGVYAVKYALNNPIASLSDSQLKVVPAKPEAVVLGADDLNSMLWTTTPEGKLTLTFTDDVKGGNPAAVNLFTKQAYKAVTPVGFPANFTYAGESGKAAYPDANKDLTAAYGKMTNAEYDYAEAAATETFDKTIQALMPKATFTDNHKAVWAAKNAIGTNVSDWATQTDKSEIAKLIDAIDLEKVKAVKDVPGLDEVKDEVLKSALAGVKTAMIKLVYAHPGESYGVKTDDIKPAAMGASVAFDRLDKIVKGNTFDGVAEVVKASVKAAEEKKEALDKVMDETKEVFETEATAAGWVSLQANHGENAEASYLAVDTAFLTSKAGDKHLAMAIKKFKDKNVRPGNEDRTRMDLNGRFNFQFVWHPASDSIVIRTAGFAKKADKTPYWSMMNKTDNPLDLGMWRANEAAKEESNGTKVEISASNKPFEQNLIKIAVLADNHREVTVGSSEYTSVGNDPVSTINTKITIGNNGLYKKTTLKEGVYYFNLVSNLPWRSLVNGKYIVANFCGGYNEYVNPEKDQIYGTAQNFDHMPRTQWVVEQNAGPVASERTINIYNREFPEKSAKNIQLYEGNNGTVFAVFGDYKVPFVADDTLSYKAVDAEVLKENIGYKTYKDDDLMHYRYTMDYYSGMGIGHKVNVSAVEADSVVFVNAKVDEKGTELQLIKVKEEAYGYKGDVVGQLKRQLYKIRTYDGSKLSNNNKYIKRGGASWDSYVLTDNESEAALFYLKENNQLTVDGKTICYYALVQRVDYDTWTTYYRAGVHDGSLEFSVEDACSETRVATFAIERDNTPYYRRLGITNKEDGFEDLKTPNAKIFDALTGEYLYEDNNSDYSKGKGIHFLGIENKKVNVKNPTLYVDTAYVRDETMMPQYMLAVGVVEHKGKMECPIDPSHNTDEYLAEHPNGCPHAVATQDYKVGRYLISFSDSVALAKNSSDYQYDRAYTRLGFVEAKHIGDTLVIYRNGVPGTATADSIFLGDNEPNKRTWALDADPSKNTKADSIHAAHKYGIKNAVFAFRLVDDAPEANFLIESTVEAPKATWGGWIKNQNGVPVIAHYENYNEAALDALVFNIEPSSEEATDNETIATTEVKVIAGEGQVTIANAAGKKVVISNILGQVVANTVLTSDNAAIAAPQGVVVVAVEGEAAVKAIVK
ncbi:DUF6383 domain-containing protein [Parabacteroides sp.]